MIRLAPLVLGVALLASACGGPRNDLAKTADAVGKIRAGTISFSLLVTPRTKLARHPFGFRLRGPFTFGDRPTAHVTYTQVANGTSATGTLVLTSGGGYKVVNGERRDLTAAELLLLRSAGAATREGSQLDVSDWIDSARQCGDGCVRGDLDVTAATDALLRYGGGTAELSDDERERLADGTRGTYRVTYGDGHVLRSLRIHVELALPVREKLRAALGNLVGANLDVSLSLANPR